MCSYVSCWDVYACFDRFTTTKKSARKSLHETTPSIPRRVVRSVTCHSMTDGVIMSRHVCVRITVKARRPARTFVVVVHMATLPFSQTTTTTQTHTHSLTLTHSLTRSLTHSLTTSRRVSTSPTISGIPAGICTVCAAGSTFGSGTTAGVYPVGERIRYHDKRPCAGRVPSGVS